MWADTAQASSFRAAAAQRPPALADGLAALTVPNGGRQCVDKKFDGYATLTIPISRRRAPVKVRTQLVVWDSGI